MMKKISYLVAIFFLLILQSYVEVQAQRPKFHYFKLNENETVVCRILDDNARTVEVVGSVTSRYVDDPGSLLNVSFSRNVSQKVIGDLVLPTQVELWFYDEMYNTNKQVGIYILAGIGSKGFNNCEITSVTIPSTVKNVNSDAFQNCKKLKTVNLPPNANVTAEAFNGCDNLTAVNVVGGTGNLSSFDGILCKDGVVFFCPPAYDGIVHIPSSVKEIGSGCFKNHQRITEVVIDNGVSALSGDAFKDCLALKSATIPGSIKSVSSSAFQGCISLERVSFNEGVAEISDKAFSGCANLHSISMPRTLSHLGNYAFENCFALESVKLGDRLEKISYGAFGYCSSLKEVILPSAVKSIQEKAFIGCVSLVKVVLPPTVSEIGRYAFFGCKALESINVPKNARYYDETFMDCNSLSLP